MTRQMVSAFLSAAVIAAAFTACKPGTMQASTTSEPGGSVSQAQSIDATGDTGTDNGNSNQQTQPQASQGATDETQGTVPVAGTAAPPDTHTSFGTNPANRKPQTTQEIVAYFNQAANRVKQEKPGYTWVETAIIKDPWVDNNTLNKVVPTVIRLFSQEPKPQPAVQKGAGHNAFPVKNQVWASRLEPQAVKSATCSEDSKYYSIRIELKPESLNAAPKDPSKTNHGKVFTVFTEAEIQENIDSIKNYIQIQEFKPNYSGSYVLCKVEKETSRMREATYYCSTTLDAKIMAPIFGLVNGKVTFIMKQDYKIS